MGNSVFSSFNSDFNKADRTFKGRRLFILAVIIVAIVSVLPFTADDTELFAGGLGEKYYPGNLLGAFGASLGRFLLLAGGLSVYFTLFLALLCSLRRLFWRGYLRKSSLAYPAGIILFGLSISMLLAIRPDGLKELTNILNLNSIPGGVIGWRLCAPHEGWLYMMFNQVSCYAISLVMLLASLYVIWYFDWQYLVLCRLAARQQEPEQPPVRVNEDEDDDEPQISVLEAPTRHSAPRQPLPPPPEPPRRRHAAPESNQPPLPLDPEPAEPKRQEPVTIPPQTVVAPPSGDEYQLPPPELLNRPQENNIMGSAKQIAEREARLQGALDQFNIDAEVINAIVGPQVTLFEIDPAAGVRIDTIGRLQGNIAMELCVKEHIRCLLPIPGKRLVGIEVPNDKPTTVTSYELFTDEAWKEKCSSMDLPLALGKNINNKSIYIDLARAPHLLIAGATGSGKSVCMNLMIVSLIYRFRPDELKMIMIDPKVVEFQPYSKLPHLIIPIINDIEKAPLALRWAVQEMKNRYELLAAVGVKKLTEFNSRKLPPEPQYDKNDNRIPDKLPYIVIIIDELADVMQCAGKEVEGYLARLAALARAVGIHVIIATQRPDVKVITGTIKSNFPVRIAFKVSSGIDSRTILDSTGAELLIGNGDMLYKGALNAERIQCGYVANSEVERINQYASSQASAQFDERVISAMEAMDSNEASTSGGKAGHGPSAGDAISTNDEETLFRKAVEVIVRDRRPTISYVQRALKVGYNKAATLIDLMEERGVLGPQPSSGSREIYDEEAQNYLDECYPAGNDDRDGNYSQDEDY